MRNRLIPLTANIFIICMIFNGYANAQKFRVGEINDKIYAIENPEDGQAQLVIESEKGLVVINSFWSEITAEKYKKSIIQQLNRDDFLYLIDMVDRLDMFGGNAAYKGIPYHQAFVVQHGGKGQNLQCHAVWKGMKSNKTFRENFHLLF